ncbi:Cadherin-like protein [Metarhizium album ARSEF 1941]|uniref:Cadherin-like protein n=1 Tax=Metarhizium album (strain ARSEF 1941) TaxID=1081103 RepID=A0A0B2WKN0_METAS|nr:Cadherin-like protein [Metarhizium album ARSEF 1941]KHN96616.1 Cadherin-like protein [Metarhizium album ARSEF 1941]
MPSPLALVALLPLTWLASCEPRTSFPFNAQLPLAARIDHFFSYSFSQYTFQSDSKTITYSLGHHPSWLSIESRRRRLYGTPRDGDVPPGDVVGQTVDIIATDDAGSKTMNATLVISRRPAPEVRIPAQDQMAKFGKFSAPSSILSYPAADFNFSFDRNTFSMAGLNYYAVSADSSPLPAWIQFDAQSLSFTGRTPPFESLVQPPQTFDFRLVASDIVGFSASSLKFSIVVGSHKLTTEQPIIALNATRGTAVTYDGFKHAIKLDGKQVSPRDLAVTTKDMPSWLSYDGKTGRVQGTPKDGDDAANFTISFSDSLSDKLDVLVVVNVATGLFDSTFEDMHIRPGSNLDLDLTKHFKNPADIAVRVSTNPTEDWLKVNGLRLSGRAPTTSRGGFKLTIDALSKSSGLSESEGINVYFLVLDGTTTTVPSASFTAATTTLATGTGVSNNKQTHPGHMTTGEILLATIIPVIFVAILLIVFVCYFRRRRSGQGYLGSKYRSKISHPIRRHLTADRSDPSMGEATAMGAFLHTETEVLKPAKSAFAEESSPISSHRRSSETLGDLSASGIPRSIMVNAARTTTIRSVSNVTSEDGRQSWVTIDGAHGGVAQSDRSSQSDVAFPQATRQLFPGADYVPGRDTGLELGLPTLEELPSLLPTPLLAYDSRSPFSHDNLGHESEMTSGSAAVPAQHSHQDTTASLTKWPTQSTAIVDGSEANWVALEESEAGGSIFEIRRPDAAAVKPARPWNEAGSQDGGKSVTTEVSFASSENWRVIGRLSPSKTERSCKEAGADISLQRPRPSASREVAQQGGHEPGAGPASSCKKGHVPSPPASGPPAPSTSRVSTMGDLGGEATDMSGGRGFDEASWMRNHSSKMSVGSFKVFL